jgi:exonuclease III
MGTTVYAVLTGRKGFDLELQIVAYSEAEGRKEVKDLKKDFGMDTARLMPFPNEEELYTWWDKENR